MPPATMGAGSAIVCVLTVLVAGCYAINVFGCACVPSPRDLALGAVTEVLNDVSQISLIDRSVVVGAVALGGGTTALLALRYIDPSPPQIFQVVRSDPRMQPSRGDEQHTEA